MENPKYVGQVSVPASLILSQMNSHPQIGFIFELGPSLSWVRADVFELLDEIILIAHNTIPAFILPQCALAAMLPLQLVGGEGFLGIGKLRE